MPINKTGTLHFFCGKMAAGKSTMAAKLAQTHNAILLSEDDWLGQLYPEEIKVFDDYIKYSARLKPLLKMHVQNLLLSGLSVVMDFPGNTKNQRRWFKGIVSEFRLSHQLHYLERSDETCITQLKERSKKLPVGSAFTTEEEFYAVNQYFQPPLSEEGFDVKVYH